MGKYRELAMVGVCFLATITGLVAGSVSDKVLYIESAPVDSVTARNVTDEGGVASLPMISGRLDPAEIVYRLGAGVDGAAPHADISSVVRPDGRFVLGQTVLEYVNGDTLEDGRHVLHLEVQDLNGLSLGMMDVPFTIDQTSIDNGE